MPIDPARLARSLGALDTLEVEQGFTGTLEQVLRSAKNLLDADRAELTLVDHTGALRWASASDPTIETREGERDQPAQAGIDAGIHPGLSVPGLSVPVQLGGGPVGTLDVHVAAPKTWDDSEAAALQAYAGLVASLLAAAATARVTGRLAAQLQEALEHRSLLEQAVEVLVHREGMDAPAAFEWLRTAARSSGLEVALVAGEVLDGAPLPSDRLVQAKAERGEATDLEVAGHRRSSELHEGAARRYEQRGQPGRAQTERLQAAAARGRIIDAEAERRRVDRGP